MTHLVSIIIPVYNRAQIISRTLDSVLMQTHDKWECILVDDGSIDNSCEVIEKYIKKDDRFKLYLRPENRRKGANACRNIGLEKAKGEYINFLDSDDTIHPQKLELQINILKYSNYQFAICQTQLIDDTTNEKKGFWSLKTTSDQPFDDYVTCLAWWSIHAVLWDYNFLQKYRFNEQLHQSQEYDLHIRVLSSVPLFYVSDEVLVNVYIHPHRISTNMGKDYSKLKSNLQVRYNCIKNYSTQLKYDTNSYLYRNMFNLFKHFVVRKEVKKACISFYYLWKATPYFIDMKGKKLKTLSRWLLSIPSYLIFNKGEGFIRYIR